MPYMPGPPAPATKEDNPTLRLLADRLVGKLTALVPYLHSVHNDVTGSIAPTDTPTEAPMGTPMSTPTTMPPDALVQGGNPNIPSIADSLERAHAIANRMEDDLLSLRGKV